MANRGVALCCLALSILMLLLVPSGFRWLMSEGESRVDESLVPKKSELITLWTLADDTGGLRTVKRLVAAFEKEHRELRVLIKKADMAEVTSPDTVKPDAILFGLGEIAQPEELFIALNTRYGCREDAALCGMKSGVRYALPLWYLPSVLAVDSSLLSGDAPRITATPEPILPLLPAQTPTPAPTQAPEEENALWKTLLGKGALQKPEGVALLQLMNICPPAMRPSLVTSVKDQGLARCLPYREAAALSNVSLVALLPASADRVMMMGLCRDNQKTRRLLDYLLSEPAQATLSREGLFAVHEDVSLPLAEYQAGLVLPNAFAMTKPALNAYCQAAFQQQGDPVYSLMSLR